MKVLLTNPDLCTGCNRCTYACSAKHEGAFAPAKARLHINTYSIQGFSAPSVCFHCKQPACLSACPERAIFKGIDGVILVNAHACNGCGKCVPACPWGMIGKNAKNGLAFKCDLCGGDPTCVKECTFGALTFEEPSSDQIKAKAKQMKFRPEDGVPEKKRDDYGKHLLSEADR